MHGPALQKRKVNDCCYKGRSHLLCELGSWWRWSHGGRPGTFDKVSCYVQIANKGGAAAKANIVRNYYTNYYANHTLVPSALLAKQVYLWAFCAPSGMEPMTKRKVAELYWSSVRVYQIFWQATCWTSFEKESCQRHEQDHRKINEGHLYLLPGEPWRRGRQREGEEKAQYLFGQVATEVIYLDLVFSDSLSLNKVR